MIITLYCTRSGLGDIILLFGDTSLAGPRDFIEYRLRVQRIHAVVTGFRHRVAVVLYKHCVFIFLPDSYSVRVSPKNHLCTDYTEYTYLISTYVLYLTGLKYSYMLQTCAIIHLNHAVLIYE